MLVEGFEGPDGSLELPIVEPNAPALGIAKPAADPDFQAMVEQLEDEIQEGRRLLYVGMTRAKDRLILTRTDQRFGKPSGGNQFLDEMGLVPET